MTTLIACVSGAIAISPLTTPAMAVMMGSSIASKDPNAMNSTTAAASRPIMELKPSGGCSAFPIASPLSWTFSQGARAASAVLITRVISALARLSACLVKLTVA